MLKIAGNTDTKPVDLEDKYGLIKNGYRLSSIQAQAILDLRLHRLTGLEQEKIVNEYMVLGNRIAMLQLFFQKK